MYKYSPYTCAYYFQPKCGMGGKNVKYRLLAPGEGKKLTNINSDTLAINHFLHSRFLDTSELKNKSR